MKNNGIVILGAGLTGLSTAYHLKSPYRIYEKESEVGGLCRSVEVGGFTFDYAAHLLHFRTDYAQNLVRRLLNGNLAVHNRKAYIYFRGRYIPYPFQANLRYLPWRVKQECLMELLKSRYSRINRKTENFSDWIENHFGKGIWKHFFLPYNQKFWKVPPENLDFKWAERFVPLPTTGEILRGAVSRNKKQYGYNPVFCYPEEGGINALPHAFLKQLREVKVNKKIKSIEMQRRLVHFEDGETASYRFLVSTIPLPELIRLIEPVPAKIQEYSLFLKSTSIFNLNIGLKEKGIEGIHWVYFPESQYSFFRAGVLSNFSPSHPENCSALYAEVAYLQNEKIDEVELVEKVVEDLLRLQLIKCKENIVVCKGIHIPYGYAIPFKNSKGVAGAILKFLEANNIISCGRYGSWSYMSVEDCILKGKNVANRIES